MTLEQIIMFLRKSDCYTRLTITVSGLTLSGPTIEPYYLTIKELERENES